MYNDNLSIEEKINVVAKEIYGAGEVVLAEKVCIIKIFLLNILPAEWKKILTVIF